VIEGVRLLPWLQEAARREPAEVRYFLDCKTCMESLTEDSRRQMGCGYLPAATGVKPAGRPPGLDETLELTACIGYTTKLPEVIEVSRARLQQCGPCLFQLQCEVLLLRLQRPLRRRKLLLERS
jgi:hypothetical protein